MVIRKYVIDYCVVWEFHHTISLGNSTYRHIGEVYISGFNTNHCLRSNILLTSSSGSFRSPNNLAPSGEAYVWAFDAGGLSKIADYYALAVLNQGYFSKCEAP